MTADPSSAKPTPSKSELFLGFLKIGMLGFGGVAPYARHVVVEERRWLEDREYAEVLGIGQALPGPNTMNAAILIGHRFQGAPGALLGVVAQLVVPIAAVVLLSLVYDHYADAPDAGAALAGAAAAASGLVMGTAFKLMRRTRPSPRALLIAAAAFAAVALLRWPLIPVVLVLAPVGVLLVRPAT